MHNFTDKPMHNSTHKPIREFVPSVAQQSKAPHWTVEAIEEMFDIPFIDLMYQAHSVHRKNFAHNHIQLSSLLSIKTGACPEDCKYCPQSGHYDTKLKKEPLIDIDLIVAEAKKVKAQGVSRFCMGAAWKNPPKKDIPKLQEIIKQVKALGLETCMTLGMLTPEAAADLSSAGLDYYNHNLDTSEEFYAKIITTRTYQDRLDTLSNVRDAGMKICSGGILGMGETVTDRCKFLLQLSKLPHYPESVPINKLIKIPSTPLENIAELDDFDFIKTIAVARIVLPLSYIRLSAGRENMNEQMQAWCFFAGANSIFYGDKLLTSSNCEMRSDKILMEKLGITTTKPQQQYPPTETGMVGNSVYYTAQ